MTAEAQVGATVWERNHPEADHAARGGMVVAFDQGDGYATLPRVLIAAVSRSVSRGRESWHLRTTWLNLEDVDPSLTTPARDRRAEAYRLGRRILRALSDRGGQPGPRDFTAIRYVVDLWLGPDNPGTLPQPIEEGDPQ